MISETSPQPYIIRGIMHEKEPVPVPFMLISSGSRRPLSTHDTLPFHIPHYLRELKGLVALTITFQQKGFPTFFSYEQPASPVALISLLTNNSSIVLTWGKYRNTETNQEYMNVPALPTLLKEDKAGNKHFWNEASGLYFNQPLTSLIGQGWELAFTDSKIV